MQQGAGCSKVLDRRQRWARAQGSWRGGARHCGRRARTYTCGVPIATTLLSRTAASTFHPDTLSATHTNGFAAKAEGMQYAPASAHTSWAHPPTLLVLSHPRAAGEHAHGATAAGWAQWGDAGATRGLSGGRCGGAEIPARTTRWGRPVEAGEELREVAYVPRRGFYLAREYALTHFCEKAFVSAVWTVECVRSPLSPPHTHKMRLSPL